MLRLDRLHLPPLAPVSLTVETGQCLGLRGASGSGKTRLLRAIADLDPCEGRLWLDGRERHQLSGPAWRAQVGYLPAEPGWWAHTVAEHFACWPDQAANLAALNLPAGLGDAPISRLSTGERQRLARQGARCCWMSPPPAWTSKMSPPWRRCSPAIAAKA